MVQHPRRAVARVPSDEGDTALLAADRARLIERVSVGLAHEGKNPLHNMMLHVQLMAEKIADPGRGGSPLERHLGSLRDGISKVDALLRAFGEFASTENLAPDLVAALARTLQLLGYEARRFNVEVSHTAPASLLVASDARLVNDLVGHLFVAAIELARDGGRVHVAVESQGPRARLELRAEGGLPRRHDAQPHLDAARRLAGAAAGELSIDTSAAAGARLSLSFVHSR